GADVQFAGRVDGPRHAAGSHRDLGGGRCVAAVPDAVGEVPHPVVGTHDPQAVAVDRVERAHVEGFAGDPRPALVRAAVAYPDLVVGAVDDRLAVGVDVDLLAGTRIRSPLHAGPVPHLEAAVAEVGTDDPRNSVRPDGDV